MKKGQITSMQMMAGAVLLLFGLFLWQGGYLAVAPVVAGDEPTAVGVCDDNAVLNIQAFNDLSDTKAAISTWQRSYFNAFENPIDTNTATPDTTPASFACGGTAHVIYGEGTAGNHYYIDTPLITITGEAHNYNQAVQLIGAVNYTMINDTFQSQTQTGGNVSVDVPTGGVAFVTLRVVQTTDNAYFGTDRYAVCFNYTVVNQLQSVEVTNAGWTKMPAPPAIGATLGAEECYESDHPLADSMQEDLSIVIQAQAGINPTTQIEPIIIDYAGYIDAGFVLPAYQNRTGLDLGAVNIRSATSTDGHFNCY